MRDFKKLKVWEKAHLLTLEVYKATKSFPKEELYGLTSQMRRSASSIPTNIAEGCGRNGEAELARFMNIALGSASELEYQTILSHELELLTQEQFQNLTTNTVEIKRMLTGFIQRLTAER